ncbi:MAG: hypothetical protein PHE21_01150 [Candidatus Dojkabacteria bacterium]|nr:hypothetical protein [Candidatus Dojkabacteria bacterium]
MQKVFKVLLIILAVSIVIILIPIVFYFVWLNGFNKNLSNKVCLSNTNLEDVSFEDRIKEFTFSSDRSAYIQFTDEELLPLISSTLENGIGQSIIQNICMDTEDGIWKIYLNMKIFDKNILWFMFDIIKDDRETAELYVDNLYLGNIPIPSFISDSIKQAINKGISDAVLLVNENSFSGREITNIQLLEGKVVLKGVK